jgi:D-sedoheptulose 7-phosphate isomerase
MNDLTDYLSRLRSTLDRLPMRQIDDVIRLLQQARNAGQTIFIMGNGGSASTASHFVCDLAKNTRQPGLPLFRVVGLTDNMAIFSAYANDEGYESAFAQQLNSLARPGDIAIGISASGQSGNVLRAIELARARGVKTVGFTGFSGGSLGGLVDLHVHVPSDIIEHVEDIHLMLEHMICASLRKTDADWASWQVPASTEILVPSGTQAADEVDQPAGRALIPMQAVAQVHLDAGLGRRGLLQRLLELTAEYVGATSGSAILVDDEGRVLSGLMVYKGRVREPVRKAMAESLDRGLAGWVLRNRQAALVSNTAEDERWLMRASEAPDQQPRSAMSVPLEDEGRIVGVLTLAYPEPGRFTEAELLMVAAMVAGLARLAAKTRDHQGS